MQALTRSDDRSHDELRNLDCKIDIAPNASGSILLSCGNTQVICAATLEADVPRWMRAEGEAGGWMTAEYSMLPYSTHDRKRRDISKGKQDGRSVEIQRLIGRSLRAVAELSKLPGHTLWIDCDVLQADGGTRTTAITGAYIAAEMAIRRAIQTGKLKESPFRSSVAATSVGILEGQPILDLCYVEDRDASVDANIVMTGEGQYVEIQSSGEEATFSGEEMEQLLGLAREGIERLTLYQTEVLRGIEFA